MERVLENSDKTAYLEKGVFLDKILLEECVAYVEPHLEEQPEIIVYGKKCKQHRNIGFFSDESIGYRYSKKLMHSKPMSPCMEHLLNVINKTLDADFNGILVNKYMNGNDYIGAHSDDESGLDKVGVVSISYGAERIFRIRDKKTKKIICNEVTTHCSVLHMGGDFQKIYTHEIPIQKKVKNSRISFTFRKHIV
jgi:alkylated DNA repair dioxygenase AlkB